MNTEIFKFGIFVLIFSCAAQAFALDITETINSCSSDALSENTFCYDLGGGAAGHATEGKWIPGIFLSGAAEYHVPQGIAARVGLVVLDDSEDRQEAIDYDRDPIWYEGVIRLESLPWDLKEDGQTKTNLGWRFDTTFRENTPTSVERTLTTVLGPRIRFKRPYSRIDLQAGIHGTFDELDDDVPRERGHGRDELRDEIFGFMASGLGEQEYSNGMITSETLQMLSNEVDSIFETKVGAALDVPTQLLFGGSSRSACYFRISAEHRFFDLDKRSDDLSFDQETNVRLEVIKHFGVRSELGYGY